MGTKSFTAVVFDYDVTEVDTFFDGLLTTERLFQLHPFVAGIRRKRGVGGSVSWHRSHTAVVPFQSFTTEIWC